MTQAVLIMTDGLRPDAISAERTPSLFSVMQQGASTLQARSVVPSITVPCHMSIFHSVPPSRHGIIDNNWHPLARPVQGLTEQLKEHNLRSAFVHNWEPLRNLNSVGSLHYSFFVNTGYDLDGDAIIAQQSVQVLKNDICDFLFIYFASIDVAGHMFAWMSDDYLKQVAIVDNLVADVLAAIPDNTSLIIMSDHGGHERSHGTELPEDMTTHWMIKGPNIRANHRIEMPVSLLDTTPTLAKIMNVPQHSDWEGKIIDEAFIDFET
jgi:predicted AlkP superfamily pyrophosphatase or phosphodiesterase